MKKMLMALAALCVAGAASAVNVEWASGTAAVTGYSGSGYYRADQSSGLATPVNSTNTCVTYAMLFTASASLSAGENILVIGDGHLSDSQRKVVIGHESGSIFVKLFDGSATGASQTVSGTIEGGVKNALAVTFDRGDSKVTIYLNGTELGSWTVSGLYGGDALDTAAIGWNVGGSNATVTTNGFYATTDTVVASDITVQNLPEPTALALLALGVAGLALRRKAV